MTRGRRLQRPGRRLRWRKGQGQQNPTRRQVRCCHSRGTVFLCMGAQHIGFSPRPIFTAEVGWLCLLTAAPIIALFPLSASQRLITLAYLDSTWKSRKAAPGYAQHFAAPAYISDLNSMHKFRGRYGFPCNNFMAKLMLRGAENLRKYDVLECEKIVVTLPIGGHRHRSLCW
jgi:hypothetical protein